MILKNVTKCKWHYFIALIFTSIAILSCEEPNKEVVLFDPGTINPTASVTELKSGESVDFTSNATKVQTLNWTFQGGTPSSSSDENVTVSYNAGGTFEVKLVVKYIDNTTENKTISITVEAPPVPVLPPITGLGIYTERVISSTNLGKTPVNNGNMVITEVTSDTNHGSNCLSYSYDPTGNGNLQSGFALSHMDLTTSPFDASAYGYLNIAIKSSTTRNVRVRFNTNSGNYWVVLKPTAPAYGMLWDGAWHALKIPFADILSNGTGASLSATAAAKSTIKQFTMRTDDDYVDYVGTANSWKFYVDDIYLTTN